MKNNEIHNTLSYASVYFNFITLRKSCSRIKLVIKFEPSEI